MLKSIQENSSDILKQSLTHCSAMDLHSLRKTCKTFQNSIPLEWTYAYLLVSDRPFTHHQMCSPNKKEGKKCTSKEFESLLKKCLYLETIHLTQTQQTCVYLERFEHLSSIMIGYCLSLEKFRVSHTPVLRDVWINNCPDLASLHLPKEAPIESLNIFNTVLDEFTIYGWKTLKWLVWVNNEGSIDTLHIPRECVNLETFNLSGSAVKKVIIEAELVDELYIQANHLDKLHIHTTHKNHNKIFVNLTNPADIPVNVPDSVPFIGEFRYVVVDFDLTVKG